MNHRWGSTMDPHTVRGAYRRESLGATAPPRLPPRARILTRTTSFSARSRRARAATPVPSGSACARSPHSEQARTLAFLAITGKGNSNMNLTSYFFCVIFFICGTSTPPKNTLIGSVSKTQMPRERFSVLYIPMKPAKRYC